LLGMLLASLSSEARDTLAGNSWGDVLTAPPGGGGESRPGLLLFGCTGGVIIGGTLLGVPRVLKSLMLELGVTPRFGVTGRDTAPRRGCSLRKDDDGVSSVRRNTPPKSGAPFGDRVSDQVGTDLELGLSERARGLDAGTARG
jgi:hypothetical protein